MKINAPALIVLTFLCALAPFTTARAQGTAFTYQGRLFTGTNAATGLYDLRFALFDAATAGAQQGSLVTNTPTAVTNGLFTVALDFGNQFPGAARWLELAVRPTGGTAFTNLAPRQPLTPTPYAIAASNLIGSLPVVKLYGTIASSNLPAGLGGGENVVTGVAAVAAGGTANTASGLQSSVGGGVVNVASGQYATVPGGAGNIASGNSSFAAGNDALAVHQGAFVWADSQNAFFSSSNNDTFNVRAKGGARFVTSGAGLTVDGPLVASGSSAGIASGSSIDPAIVARLYNLAVDGTTGTPDYAGLAFGRDSTRQAIVGGSFGNDYLDFYTGGLLTTPKMRIDFNGNVGIGNGPTNPAAKLQVNGTIIAAGFSGSGASLTGLPKLAGGNAFTGQQSVMSGSVGIGITSPGTLLHLFAGTDPTLKIQSDGVDEVSGRVSLRQSNDTGFDTYYDGNSSMDALVLESFTGGASTTKAMVLKLNGNVGIGVTNPVTALQVNGTVSVLSGNVGIGTTSPMGSIGYPAGWTGLHTLNATANGLTVIEGATSARLHLRADNNTPNTAQDFIIANGNNRVDFEWLGAGLADGPKVLTLTPTARVGIGTTLPATTLDVAGEITCTAVNLTSDRNAKENFKALDPRAVLAKVALLPITEWQYKAAGDKDAPAARHIGPMAQDFSAAFALSQDDKHISVVDEGGVALAAIQGLNARLEEEAQAKDARIRDLEKSVAELKAMMTQLASRSPGGAQ